MAIRTKLYCSELYRAGHEVNETHQAINTTKTNVKDLERLRTKVKEVLGDISWMMARQKSLTKLARDFMELQKRELQELRELQKKLAREKLAWEKQSNIPAIKDA